MRRLPPDKVEDFVFESDGVVFPLKPIEHAFEPSPSWNVHYSVSECCC